jgi:hypothetical protein
MFALEWCLITPSPLPNAQFVERDTGAKHYFEVPLARALEIYDKAVSSVAGSARTVRGPSMSAEPGKVSVQGVATVNSEKVFVLKFLQSRQPKWTGKVFFAKVRVHEHLSVQV